MSYRCPRIAPDLRAQSGWAITGSKEAAATWEASSNHSSSSLEELDDLLAGSIVELSGFVGSRAMGSAVHSFGVDG